MNLRTNRWMHAEDVENIRVDGDPLGAFETLLFYKPKKIFPTWGEIGSLRQFRFLNFRLFPFGIGVEPGLVVLTNDGQTAIECRRKVRFLVSTGGDQNQLFSNPETRYEFGLMQRAYDCKVTRISDLQPPSTASPAPPASTNATISVMDAGKDLQGNKKLVSTHEIQSHNSNNGNNNNNNTSSLQEEEEGFLVNPSLQYWAPQGFHLVVDFNDLKEARRWALNYNFLNMVTFQIGRHALDTYEMRDPETCVDLLDVVD